MDDDGDDDVLGLSLLMGKPSTVAKRKDSDSDIHEDEFSLENLLKTEHDRKKRLAKVFAAEAKRDEEETNKRMFMDETPEETKALDAEVSIGGATSQMFHQEDDGPPPKGFFKQQPLLEQHISSTTNVMKLFFSPQSSEAWDALFGAFTCEASVDLPKLKLTDKTMVEVIFTHLREAKLGGLSNVKRGLRALKQVEDLDMKQYVALHAIRFACYANSLHCEVELSCLINAYTSAAVDSHFAIQILPLLIQENDMNGNLFRFCRVGKLFMPPSYPTLRALVDLFVGSDEWFACWNNKSKQRGELSTMLLQEVESRPAHMQSSEDFHRWYSILTLIEFQLRWVVEDDNEEESKRAKVCCELKLCKKRFNQSGLLAFLNTDQYLTDISSLYT